MRKPTRRVPGVLATGTLAVTLAAGCSSSGGSPGGSPRSDPPPASAVEVTKPYDDLRPTRVEIPAIGAASDLITVAVTVEGEMAVPPAREPMQAAWYRLSPVPGEDGPAILLGHVDGYGEPGIFHDLHRLEPGDEIRVHRSDDRRLTFTVTGSERVPKEEFPTEAVYGNTEGPELRLITCGGVFDDAEHSYTDNVIVNAERA
ncbi:class F sortase [Saccharomonospora halophila]|uniref:class F sortase n=1 Tax=Saccharomonospora halophila TaxID=129922 RepID=UPI000365AA38|nr:class F sortase [Saccharomonospora halophila]